MDVVSWQENVQSNMPIRIAFYSCMAKVLLKNYGDILISISMDNMTKFPNFVLIYKVVYSEIL